MEKNMELVSPWLNGMRILNFLKLAVKIKIMHLMEPFF